MKFTRAIIPVIVAAALLVPPESSGGTGWEKKHAKKGVTVWARDVDGSPNVETKVVAKIAATTDEVWDYLNDPDNLKTVAPAIKEYRDLGSCGERCKYVYQRIHRPPINDRHWVLKVRWSVQEKDGLRTYRRWTKATRKKSPPVTGPMLLEKVSGSWVIRPVDGGDATRMTRLSHLEIGGGVPAILFNGGAVKNAYKFMLRLKNVF